MFLVEESFMYQGMRLTKVLRYKCRRRHFTGDKELFLVMLSMQHCAKGLTGLVSRFGLCLPTMTLSSCLDI